MPEIDPPDQPSPLTADEEAAIRTDLAAALAALRAAGYAVAPREPTEAMLAAGDRSICDKLHMDVAYRAMVAAAEERGDG